MSLTQKPKAEVLPPHNAMALDTLAGVRGEMARLYRLALNGKIRSDEMTRFIYALKEIRACIDADCALGRNVDPFTLHIYAALAEQERRMISQRTRAGLQ